MQTIGVTDLTITYSRPAVKGTRIWGDASASAAPGTSMLDGTSGKNKEVPVVAYGRVWRTGANEVTTFVITDDVLINGQNLAAGSSSTIETKRQRQKYCNEKN